MSLFFDQKIKDLAMVLSAPLYAVGGYVRNFLIDGSISSDLDLCAPITAEEFESALNSVGLHPVGIYKRTGTVLFKCGEFNCEFTSFREEKYADGGGHTPISVKLTDDIYLDAVRRDFKCNAVYYDIAGQKLVDVLDGAQDIKNRVVDTVTDAKKVFSHDGLRLMRLCRFVGELGFTASASVVENARLYSKNILDISKERVLDELKKILVADTKYRFSQKDGHYTALKLLEEIGVLELLIPELTLGKGMPQRKDYHKYDVLEHTFRTVLYSRADIRLASLLHDVGKPKQFLEYGKYHGHDKTGAIIAKDILARLKVDNKLTAETLALVETHMYDISGDTGERKLRLFLVKNYENLDKMLALRQADFSAGKDDLSVAPVVKKWQKLLDKMKVDGTPFALKDLAVNAGHLIELGVKDKNIGMVLEKLFVLAVKKPEFNDFDTLLPIAKNFVLDIH